MNKEWSTNAENRYHQVMGGVDITFTEVFLPYWREYFSGEYKNKDILEIGCGTGILSKKISRQVRSLTCIEPNCEMYKLACKHNEEEKNILIANCTIEEYICEIKYDVCVAHMVVHNIATIDKAFNQINKLLKEGSSP